MNNLIYYLSHITLGLLINQLLTSDLTSYIIFGLGLLVIHSYIIFNYYKDHFLFIIYMFSLCIMGTFEKLGGITLVPVILLIPYFAVAGNLKIKDIIVKILLIVLVVSNFLGYLIKNDLGNFEIIQSGIIFTGSVLTFVFVANYEFNRLHYNTLIRVITFLSILLFLAAFNQKFVLFDSTYSILGRVKGFGYVSHVSNVFGDRIPSLFGDYELFSEFSLLMFIIAFCLLMDKISISYFELGTTPFILAFFSLMNILITGTRSSFLLMFVFIAVYFLLKFKSVFSSRAITLILAVLIMIPMLIKYGNLVGLDVVIERLSEINVGNINVDNIQSGEEMNRQLVYAVGHKRLEEENWLLGNGYGTENSNRNAWFGGIGEIADFHSLYLCFPMIYGWIGGFAYLGIIFYVIFLLFKRFFILNNRATKSLVLGFALLFVFFLLNQIKINSLRLYHYHYLIWILLGIAVSITNIKSSEIVNEETDEVEDTLVY